MDNHYQIEFITFFLAIIGYAGLTLVMLFSLTKKVPVNIWRFITLIIISHVIMIWYYRYKWQFNISVRNGYSGFIIFHLALFVIIISNFVNSDLSKLLIRISFLIITIGAVGAVFKYDVVEIYKVPVIIFAAAGSTGFLKHYIYRN